jgi:hypothetical protein
VQRFGDACDKRAVLADITPRGLAVLRETLTKALVPLERLASSRAFSSRNANPARIRNGT